MIMASIDTISTANKAVAGRGYDSALYALQRHKGREVNLLTKVDLGTPIIGVTDALLKAATSTELPNAATKTYVPGTVASPLDSASLPATTTIKTVDGSVLVWELDTDRNITAAVTHGSAALAMTITITGYDKYRAKVVKTITTAAGGTSQSGATTATFKYIASIVVTSASNATTNTLNLGFGNVLGLPFKLAEKSDLISTWFDDAVDSATVVAAVATTPSATTGDVRGTVTIAGTLNGTKKLKLWMHVSEADAATRNGLLGVANYAG